MSSPPLISLHKGDLPEGIDFGDSVAIDTETLGLIPRRDRLCVVQLSPGDGNADVVQIPADVKSAPNLEKLLADPGVTKIFHYARSDMAVLKHRFGVVTVTIEGEEYAIADIGMRMLQPHELAAAQGFPADYTLIGTKSEQVAKIGNSVCPPVAEALVRANLVTAAERRMEAIA